MQYNQQSKIISQHYKYDWLIAVLVYSVSMSLISLFTHMCTIGFGLLAINEKTRDKKNLYIAMAIVFFGLTFVI